MNNFVRVQFESSVNEVKSIRSFYENVKALLTDGYTTFIVPETAPFFTYQWPDHIISFEHNVLHSEAFNEIFEWCTNNGYMSQYKKRYDFEGESYFVLEILK